MKRILILVISLFLLTFSSMSVHAADDEIEIITTHDLGYFDVWRHADGKTWQDTNNDGLADKPGDKNKSVKYGINHRSYFTNEQRQRIFNVEVHYDKDYGKGTSIEDYISNKIVINNAKYMDNAYIQVNATIDLICDTYTAETAPYGGQVITKEWQEELVDGRRFYIPVKITWYLAKPAIPKIAWNNQIQNSIRIEMDSEKITVNGQPLVGDFIVDGKYSIFPSYAKEKYYTWYLKKENGEEVLLASMNTDSKLNLQSFLNNEYAKIKAKHGSNNFTEEYRMELGLECPYKL